MPRGGKRTGAGRPRGSREARTLERAAVLRAYRDRVMRQADRLLEAQLTLAQGCSFLFRVEKAKEKGERAKHELVRDPEEITKYLNGEVDATKYYYVTTERPDGKAIADMLDRTFNKAVQGLEVEAKGWQPLFALPGLPAFTNQD